MVAKQNRTPATSSNFTECGYKYALAVSDPWNIHASGACVPRFPAQPSAKRTHTLRITAFVGTSGQGFALFAPCLANDSPSVWFTTASFAGSSNGSILHTNTGVPSTVGVSCGFINTGVNGNSMSNISNGSAVNNGRVVSYGASIQYVGTALNMGGVYNIITNPEHHNVYASSEFAGLSERVIPISRRKEWAMASATTALESDYSTGEQLGPGAPAASYRMVAAYPFSGGNYIDLASFTNGYLNGAPIIKFAFSGTPGNSFQIDIVQHSEYIGTQFASSVTASSVDTRAFEAVTSAAVRVPYVQNQNNESWTTVFNRVLKQVLRENAPMAASAALKLGVAMLI